VLDDTLDPCSIGTAGDLYIAGDCLAVGYVGDASLTADKFLPDPWGPNSGERMYRTGDRARWLPDGNLQFLGRLDQQVKIRGYRIELQEIQAALCQHPAVHEAIVTVRQAPPGPRIASFVRSQEAGISGDELRRFLARSLPEYMVPPEIEVVAQFPVSPTGKIDRQKLLELGARPSESTPPRAGRRPPEPQDDSGYQSLQLAFRNLWVETLDVAAVEANDSFFGLGGDSLAAARLVARLQERLQLPIEVRDIFDHPQLGELLSLVTSRMKDKEPPETHSAPDRDWQHWEASP
jgi:acyl carrier protein